MKKLPTLPTKVLKEHPSLAYWCVHWKRACGCTETHRNTTHAQSKQNYSKKHQEK